MKLETTYENITTGSQGHICLSGQMLESIDLWWLSAWGKGAGMQTGTGAHTISL